MKSYATMTRAISIRKNEKSKKSGKSDKNIKKARGIIWAKAGKTAVKGNLQKISRVSAKESGRVPSEDGRIYEKIIP